MMGEFLEQLKQLLDNTKHITKQEVKEAARLVKKRRWELSLRQEGPCLNCGEAMPYGSPCTTHVNKGDNWLDSLFAKWGDGKPSIGKRYNRDLTVNGYRWTTIEPYICVHCKVWLNELVMDFERQQHQEAKKQQRETREYEHALIMGKIKGSPSKRFWALRNHISNESIQRLQELPYQEFLETVYWDTIRKYVLYKRRYSCEMCNSNGTLNVHHRTYEHHGEEHDHLDDLIVLCQDCHAKFHDKLVA